MISETSGSVGAGAEDADDAEPAAVSSEAGGRLRGLTGGRRGLRALIDHLPAMVGYWGADLRNRIANQAYLEWFGKTPEELDGTHIRELLGEELFALNLPYIQEALAGREQRFDRTIVDARGRTRYSQAAYIPDWDDTGQVDGFFVLVADVSARVEAEQALAAEQERAERLADQLRIVSMASASLQDLDPVTVQERLADALTKLGYAGSNLAVLDRDAGVFVASHGRGLLAVPDGLRLPLTSGSTGAALDGGGIMVIEDYQSFPDALGAMTATGVRTVVSVPVRAGGETVAVLHVGHAEVRKVDEPDREVLSLIADIAGIAWINARRYHDQRLSADESARAALTDPLTGVGNRAAAERFLDDLLLGDVLVVLDLDHFKKVNDEHGHLRGDQTLRAFAQTLQAGLRRVDHLARTGGEEFLMVLAGTGLAEADAVLNRLRQRWLAANPATTFSAGFALSGPEEPPRKTYVRADQALYAAKANGRDQALAADSGPVQERPTAAEPDESPG